MAYNADNIWDSRTIERFRVLWDQGKTLSEIASELKTTRCSVAGKARRLRLPARSTPIVRGMPAASLRRQRQKRKESRANAGLPLLSSEQSAVDAPKPVIVKPMPVVMAPMFTGRIAECCWPTSDGKPWTWCNDPTVPGKDYCAEHAARVYVARRERAAA